MFRIGSRVVVVGSVHDGNSKKTSPKIGSYGYVSSASSYHVNTKNNFFGQHTAVIFNRYGSEDRNNRHEHKVVTNVISIPAMIPNGRYLRNGVFEHISKFILNMPKINQERAEWVNLRVDIDGPPSIVVLAEATCCPISLVDDKNEFTAWLHAITSNGVFNGIMYKLHPEKRGTLQKNKKFAPYFADLRTIAGREQVGWSKVFDMLTSTREKRANTINSVIAALSTTECQNHRAKIVRLNQNIGADSADPAIDAYRFYGNILQYLWNIPMYLEVKKIIDMKGGKDSENGIQKVQWVKQYLELLVPKLLVNKD